MDIERRSLLGGGIASAYRIGGRRSDLAVLRVQKHGA
jgi:hypothetical protein